ncbi:MAG: type II toxin-antitoxin system death-on-curing family toxin [Spirochaetales bacterium]
MSEWRWIQKAVVLAIHDRQIAEHGGLPGLRDDGALASALARPENKATCEKPDLADLAAAYAYGLARNHPFADGNKRIAWVVARLFVADNGGRLRFDPLEAIQMVLAMASGTLTEPEVAAWFRQRLLAQS